MTATTVKPRRQQTPSNDLTALQRQVGNRTVVDLLAIAQAKLEVGSASDAFEDEADRVARDVVATLSGGGSTASPSAGSPGPATEAWKGPVGEVGEEGGALSAETETAVQRARGNGMPLAEGARASMEQAMGADFSQVRVHAGPEAHGLNRRLQARAFTIGNDIFFRGSLPDATTTEGQGLLAHELAHTLQQGGGQQGGVSAHRTSQHRVARRPEVISRLTITPDSLGNTGAVGQVKGVVGLSNYLNIKKELVKYYQGPLVMRPTRLQRILALIGAWMQANSAGTSEGNQSRMAKLRSLEAEVRQELATPPTTAATTTAAPVTTQPTTTTTQPTTTITPPTTTTVATTTTAPTTTATPPTATTTQPVLDTVEKAEDAQAEAQVVQTAPVDIARAGVLAGQLRQMSTSLRATKQVAAKVSLIEQMKPVLLELLPLLRDPEHRALRDAIAGYARQLVDSLPGLQEQASYMKELSQGQEKFAYLTLQGVRAIADAVELAAGNTDSTKAGMSDEALRLVTEYGLTDAEVAAIKIYTADDFKYMNPGLEKNRGGWLQSKILDLDNPRVKDNRILGAELQPGHFGPLSPADTAAAEGVYHAQFTMAGLKKLPAWSGTTYRGMALDPADFKKQFEDPTEWKGRAFTSTSVNQSVADNFIKQNKGGTKIAIALVFTVNNGRDIHELSVYGGEGEILLMSGATAHIDRIEDKGGGKWVYLTQTA